MRVFGFSIPFILMIIVLLIIGYKWGASIPLINRI